MTLLIIFAIILLIITVISLIYYWAYSIKNKWYCNSEENGTIILSLKQFIIFNEMFPDRVFYVAREEDFGYFYRSTERRIYYKDKYGHCNQIAFKWTIEYLFFDFYRKKKNKLDKDKEKYEAKVKFLKDMSALIKKEDEKARNEIDSANSFFKEMNEKLK